MPTYTEAGLSTWVTRPRPADPTPDWLFTSVLSHTVPMTGSVTHPLDTGTATLTIATVVPVALAGTIDSTLAVEDSTMTATAVTPTALAGTIDHDVQLAGVMTSKPAPGPGEGGTVAGYVRQRQSPRGITKRARQWWY